MLSLSFHLLFQILKTGSSDPYPFFCLSVLFYAARDTGSTARSGPAMMAIKPDNFYICFLYSLAISYMYPIDFSHF